MSKIVLEDFNEGDGYYKVNLAYLSKEQVEEIEALVSKWKPTDETIKACIGMCLTDVNEQRFKDYGTSLRDCLAWLEKQGEQKSADKVKVEPKFKVGVWIVWKDKCYKVNDNGCGYELIDTNSLSTSLEYGTVDENAHLWTIEDAKNGDVLVASDGSLFIFAKVKDNSAYYHFSLCKNGSMEISDGKHAWETSNSCHPAAKEQRDLLFQKMREAGYVWDVEEKEFRKIEQVSAWSEEDETVLNNLIYALANDRIGNDRDEYISWLKSLKQRLQ